MLDERKASILRAVVEEYIQTAQPVGSGHVAKAPGIDVSSATVRNEMAALEGDGYLTQPHTSAGRIPTEKGYREFVDALAEPSLDRTAQQQVRSFFDQAHGEIERMLADTTRLLAGLTDYAAVVVGPPHEAAKVRAVQLVSLAPTVALFVAVLGNGAVEKRTIDLPVECDEAVLAQAAQHLSGALVGQPLAASASVASAEPPPVQAVVAAVRAALATGLADDADHVFVDGT
ncbi:MAG TPA: heat-inducible transcriptional repressor HrcA, partial [Aquihabitans sp.]|nr:heat-inducible transcriptional repressor HrcA [Aquihabitans sp.]